MNDIDWLGVEMVCQGESLKLRYPDEKRAVIRRLAHRMLDPGDDAIHLPPGKISASEVARRLCTTERSVMRMRKELPPATRKPCPDCGQSMWVLADGSVERHSTALYQTCGSRVDLAAVAS